MTAPKRYRSRATIEAMGPLTPSNATEITQWCGGVWWDEGRIEFHSDGFPGMARLGDWIMRQNGEFYQSPGEDFEEYYEPLEET